MNSAADRPLRLGLIIPSGGPEADYYHVEAAAGGRIKLLFTISRVGGAHGDDHDPAALEETGRIDWLTEAAGRLSGFELDAIHWACTSGSFVLGRAFAERQALGLTAALGVPASSTSLGFAAACVERDLRRVAVLATYPAPTAALFVDFLAAFGIETVKLDCLDARSGWDSAAFGETLIAAHAGRFRGQDIDALLIPDTALSTLHYLDRLEAMLGLPVLSANAVTLWDAGRIAGRGLAVDGLGSLLAGRAGPGIAPSS